MIQRNADARIFRERQVPWRSEGSSSFSLLFSAPLPLPPALLSPLRNVPSPSWKWVSMRKFWSSTYCFRIFRISATQRPKLFFLHEKPADGRTTAAAVASLCEFSFHWNCRSSSWNYASIMYVYGGNVKTTIGKFSCKRTTGPLTPKQLLRLGVQIT